MTGTFLQAAAMRARCLLYAFSIALTPLFPIMTVAATGQAEVDPRFTEETPFVRSSPVVVDTMLDMARVRATDFLIDLGSGDGRTVITAAKVHGARGFGVDYDPRRVAIANENARKEGVDDRVKFIEQDLLKTELGSATVISMYLLPEYNMALRPRMYALKPGIRIVSHDWNLGDWEADAKIKIAVPDKAVGLEKTHWIYLWVVPAKVGGAWRSRIPFDQGWVDAVLRFNQQFQKISGDVTIGRQKVPLERASLSGNFVSFRIQLGNQTILFNGQVQSGRIAGQVTLSGGRAFRWRALRS